jgi:F-box/WD-40 domain protein MET30
MVSKQIIVNGRDLKTGDCIQTLRGHAGCVFCVQLSDKYIVSGGEDKNIIVWNRNQVQGRLDQPMQPFKVLNGHTSAVVCLQFDDHKIVSGGADHSIKVRNETMFILGMEYSYRFLHVYLAATYRTCK